MAMSSWMPDIGFKLQSDYHQYPCLLVFPEDLRQSEFLVKIVPHFKGWVEADRGGISYLSSLEHDYL